MSYTVVTADENQSVFLEAPENIPGDALWSGPSDQLPTEFQISEAEKNPEGLLLWLYSNDDYTALMNSHGGIVASFERQVSENRFELALKLWNKLPIPQSLNDALFAPDGPLIQFGYQDLIAFAAANS
ncbi:MAG: hypothetical protein ACFB0C_20870 [Leptolyngbyaceae cyanobacterium]